MRFPSLLALFASPALLLALPAEARAESLPWDLRMSAVGGLGTDGPEAGGDLLVRYSVFQAGAYAARATQRVNATKTGATGFTTATLAGLAGFRVFEIGGYSMDLLATFGRHQYGDLGSNQAIGGQTPFVGARFVVGAEIWRDGPIFFSIGAEAFLGDDVARRSVVENVPLHLSNGMDIVNPETVTVGTADTGILLRLTFGVGTEYVDVPKAKAPPARGEGLLGASSETDPTRSWRAIDDP